MEITPHTHHVARVQKKRGLVWNVGRVRNKGRVGTGNKGWVGNGNKGPLEKGNEGPVEKGNKGWVGNGNEGRVQKGNKGREQGPSPIRPHSSTQRPEDERSRASSLSQEDRAPGSEQPQSRQAGIVEKPSRNETGDQTGIREDDLGDHPEQQEEVLQNTGGSTGSSSNQEQNNMRQDSKHLLFQMSQHELVNAPGFLEPKFCNPPDPDTASHINIGAPEPIFDDFYLVIDALVHPNPKLCRELVVLLLESVHVVGTSALLPVKPSTKNILEPGPMYLEITMVKYLVAMLNQTSSQAPDPAAKVSTAMVQLNTLTKTIYQLLIARLILSSQAKCALEYHKKLLDASTDRDKQVIKSQFNTAHQRLFAALKPIREEGFSYAPLAGFLASGIRGLITIIKDRRKISNSMSWSFILATHAIHTQEQQATQSTRQIKEQVWPRLNAYILHLMAQLECPA
ncbi:hypothetical protein PtA15_1A1029 [Puccinia triticina]|uniref:Uncharacterized protein n=1 Tax=Puccinia triticina TaxID=208348 RepID=A0ABY7CFV5_9BASI|nr:uncharacterized protein PtA15_1A1029 [Puccinia triticina]WAQ81687.1 hypothetical protein PtA15_1A1029 [Puccinia triticina]